MARVYVSTVVNARNDRVWARVRVPSEFSARMGDDRSDTAWLGVDGRRRVVSAVDAPRDEWTWVRVGAPVELGEGRHTLDLRVRERGIEVDRLVLSRRDAPPEG